jgi:hypothetical protein
MMPRSIGGSVRQRWSGWWRAALMLALAGQLVTIDARPGYAGAPSALPAQAASDLGTVRADGVTLTDSLGSFGQANAYTFRVADGPGAAQVYVGDLWYDVEVLLLRASALPDDPAQWRSMACGAGCVASAPASARRRIQLVQPKGLIEPVETGSYAIVVRPRDEADFSASRQFTVRVLVSPPVCAVSGDADGGYRLALAMTPASPRRSDLVTLTAYVLPPFGDLFDFELSVDGQPIASNGPVAQVPARDLTGGRAGGHQVQVVARGTQPYPDPDQPETPPSLTAGCTLTPA